MNIAYRNGRKWLNSKPKKDLYKLHNIANKKLSSGSLYTQGELYFWTAVKDRSKELLEKQNKKGNK